jgi:hypothetical protein
MASQEHHHDRTHEEQQQEDYGQASSSWSFVFQHDWIKLKRKCHDGNQASQETIQIEEPRSSTGHDGISSCGIAS